MDLETYFQQPINKRIEIVNSSDVNVCQFWLAQLHLAVMKHSPIGLGLLDKRLAAEYWALIEAKKLQTA